MKARVKEQTSPKPRSVVNYGIAVLSVIVATITVYLIKTKLPDNAPYVSVFLCAVIFTTWFGGTRSGLLSILLSTLALCYYFLTPFRSFALDFNQILRLLFFMVPSFFIVWLSTTQRKISESLRQARNVLEETAQQLRQTNTALREEIAIRKQAEEALRKSEDHTRLIIDTIPTMVWTVQPDGKVDFFNQRWLDYTGHSLEVIEDPLQIIHPEDRSRAIEKWSINMVVGKPFDDEMRLRKADGECRWFLIRIAPLHDEQGNLIKWYGVSIDIDDSKQLSHALKESEQRFLSLFQNMAEGVAYFQMLFKDGKLQDAIYLEVNPAWENLTGLKNVIGRRITEILPGILETNSEFFERSARVALTGQSERFEAYSNLLKKWLSTSAYCPKKEHVIVVMDDITERKLAEEKLQQVNSELHGLSSHLQNIQENERTTIAREIHDELGQLLTGLKMEVGWLNKKLPNDIVLKEKGTEILSIISEVLKTVKRIAIDLRPNILDELGLIAALEWQGQEFEKGRKVKFQFHTGLKDLNAERTLSTNIFRVHQEALTNIARHADATKIETTLEKGDDWLRLTIQDNGKGFDVNEEKDKNSFGLIGMKERALMLQGELLIESKKSKGTVITLKVPLVKTEKKES